MIPFGDMGARVLQDCERVESFAGCSLRSVCVEFGSPIDPRLAALYDTDNPDGPDHDYFRRCADLIDARTIIDLGCGTGIMTVTLATGGRSVVGIDPDPGMLEVARRRPGTEGVEWRIGDSQQIGIAEADLVLMTGNVAQHIGPSDWPRALGDIATGLRRGGLVSFESRNPAVEAWRTWNDDGQRTARETPFGRLIEWQEVSEPDHEGTVVLTAHNRWEESGDDVVVTVALTFRTLEQITRDLGAAGLRVIESRGGWFGEPFDRTSSVMVISAARA